MPEFKMTPEIEHAFNISQTNNLREQLGVRVNHELLKHNKIDDIKSELKTQNYLAAEQLDELTSANRQLKEETLMLEGRLDAFREQNEELRNQNQQLNSQLKEAVEKAGKPNYKMDFIISLLVVIVGEAILHWEDVVEFILNLFNQ